MEEADRLRRRAGAWFGHGRQLLGHGRHGSVRPVQRDLLLQRQRRRPRSVRPRANARRRRLLRDLEPGVHAVRAQPERRRCQARSAAGTQHRHRRRARAHVLGGAGQAQHLRHRSVALAGRQSLRDLTQEVRRQHGSRRRQHARDRRPRAHDRDHDRRRRDAGPHGARIRAAARDAPGHSPRPPPGHRKAVLAPGDGQRDRADGRAISGAARTPRFDRLRRRSRRSALPPDHRARSQPARRSLRSHGQNCDEDAARRGRLPAVRYLRFSARFDRSHLHRARLCRRPKGLRRGARRGPQTLGIRGDGSGRRRRVPRSAGQAARGRRQVHRLR